MHERQTAKVTMKFEEVLERLNRADVSIERLLDECRAPDFSLWEDHPELYVKFVDRLLAFGHPGRALDLAREGAKSEPLAAEVIRRIETQAGPAAEAGNLWPAATLGEALLLVGRHEQAMEWYHRAVQVATERHEVGNLSALRNNLRRLQECGA